MNPPPSTSLCGGISYLLRSCCVAGADTLTCFEHAHVGLDKSPTWYQYGYYGNVQGPIKQSGATGAQLRRFAEHVYNMFNVPGAGMLGAGITCV